MIVMIVQFIGKYRVNTWWDNPWQGRTVTT